MGESSTSTTNAEECEDPLALLDPKEELLSDSESFEDDKDKTDVPAAAAASSSSTDVNHKVLAHTPPETSTKIVPALAITTNNGKF